MDDVDELLDGGVARVILGTAALDDPGLVRRATTAHPGRVALGLDYRRSGDGRAEVAVRGWEQGSGRTVGDLLDEVAGAGLAAVVVTSIERDGMLGGPDLEGLLAVLVSTDVPVIASGGVGSVDDVVALDALEAVAPDGGVRRLAGAITGKALVDGRMTVEEGVAACARSV
jgi:phosphoribosylformimino-5-aminoimidazole carboxamide ribotide isomerase